MDRFSALKIRDFDHIEFAVADLEKGIAPWLKMGFEKIALREIAERRLKSYLLGVNQAFVLVSNSALRTDPVAKFVEKHGDGAFNIAFRCDDAVAAIDVAANRGAEVVEPPKYFRREFGSVHSAMIRTPGDLRHTFISREGNLFAEGFEVPIKGPRRPAGVRRVEEIAIALENGRLEAWSAFYEKILGLKAAESYTVDLQPGKVASRLLQSPSASLPIRLNESQDAKNPIQEYLEVNHGAGLQYATLSTENILATVRSVRREGIAFRQLPPSSPEALAASGLPAGELRDLPIRVEVAGKGKLLHAYTRNTTGPFFFSLQQREEHSGFGEAAFTTLMSSHQS